MEDMYLDLELEFNFCKYVIFFNKFFIEKAFSKHLNKIFISSFISLITSLYLKIQY